MTQTMLAILAITLATLFAMQQHRNVAHMQMKMIRDDIGVQATGVAVDRLDEIGAKAFDQNTIGDEKADHPDSLTAGPPFAVDQQSNDIDDFHNVAADTFRVHGTDTLFFRIESYVTYALDNEPGTPTTGPTKVKKVSVKAYSLDIPGPDTIRLSQSFACGSRCTW